MAETSPPSIVGLGGTVHKGSTTESALRACLEIATELGARTRVFGGPVLGRLPMYGSIESTPESRDFVGALAEADGVVIASPSYHGTLSGLVKNALDYVEDLRSAPRVYLTDVPVGILVTGGGAQVLGQTIGAIRSVVHAVRGCPTPFAAAVMVDWHPLFHEGRCTDPGVSGQLERLAAQVVRYSRCLAGSGLPVERTDSALSTC